MWRRVVVALLLMMSLVGCGEDTGVQVRGTAPAERVEAYEAMAVVAVGQVRDLWGAEAVSSPVEVVLPGSDAEFATLTGGAPASQEAPAVTVGSLEAAHIVIHPDSWVRLTPQGRQAVLTHEVTHLSMQGDGGVPAWLGEGLAEYTAHRTSALAPGDIAGSALQGVRAGAVPADWPALSSTDRGPVAGDAWAGYALSWLACLYLAQTYSEEQLVEFYQEVSAGTPVSTALPDVFGVSEADALAGWGHWLTTL